MEKLVDDVDCMLTCMRLYPALSFLGGYVFVMTIGSKNLVTLAQLVWSGLSMWRYSGGMSLGVLFRAHVDNREMFLIVSLAYCWRPSPE